MTQARRLSVLALVPYPLGRAPGQRYRIEQWAPYLEREGIDVSFLPFANQELADVLYEPGRFGTKALEMLKCVLRRIGHVWSSSSYDVLYLYREASLVGPAWFERVARFRNKRLVYDFDDAIWLSYVSPRNQHLSYLKFPGKTSKVCGLADTVIAGSENLAAFARRYSSSVTVVPSTVSLATYRPRPPWEARATPVVGWTGSHSSAQYLRLVERPLQRLAEHHRFRFLAIGVETVRMAGVDVECRAWRSETEVDDLWDMDIGLMPLPDDPWTRGKCAMKAIQYLAVGIPAVVSPIGANAEVVRHGENGFHAVTEDDWLDSMGRLLREPALRRQLGLAGRATVERQYSAEVQAPRVARLLRGMTP